MNRKRFFQWGFLLLVIIFIGGACFFLVRDILFFATRKETGAKIISISDRSGRSDYSIRLVYYNERLEKDVKASVFLKRSYREQIERFDGYVNIYYSGVFPRHVYIIDCRVPRKGIIVFELLVILVLSIALRGSLNEIKANKK